MLSSTETFYDVWVDERTHLIPPATESETSLSPDAFVVDRQKLEERMERIVRAKEGKMVNVNFFDVLVQLTVCIYIYI
ncbi:hypothetical protein M413DRAFT_442331 [Hebeloma cylindrosporum]|uniref:Uncharacterized protein n=1 Tax=Hebeloma cylindrosporum TaxID=76867 RepID=A0A0C3CNN8_HEBCY|nr:hypothetical protein M413DRAFT_442331 [Hebeloma cylindrosporum h7]